jgi:predicted RNA-binding protein associated with RNAse of E/G family
VSDHITLLYHRPPNHTSVFVQDLLHESDDVLVTYQPHTPMKRPLIVDNDIVLEDGSPAIWFTFPGRMHDVGRFHTADGKFTGLYANIIEPITLETRTDWTSTDLFLDVWIGADGTARLLDFDELEHAVAQGWISEETSQRARAEADKLIRAYQQGSWPPAIVNEWTISRVRRTYDF